MAPEKHHILIDLGEQRLDLKNNHVVIKTYPVSTAKNGPGERLHSGCTPRGKHTIAEKIGAGARPNTVFIGREPTGEIYHYELKARHPERDWILTRILWLQGEEPGLNKGGDVDTYSRYIYIHGSPDDVKMGEAGSAGCIRMGNADVIELFDLVSEGCEVILFE